MFLPSILYILNEFIHVLTKNDKISDQFWSLISIVWGVVFNRPLTLNMSSHLPSWIFPSESIDLTLGFTVLHLASLNYFKFKSNFQSVQLNTFFWLGASSLWDISASYQVFPSSTETWTRTTWVPFSPSPMANPFREILSSEMTSPSFGSHMHEF